MKITAGIIAALSLSSMLSGCARIDFGNNKGLTYYDPKPYVLVTTTKDCLTAATVITLPGEQREMKFDWGWGSYNLSANLSPSGTISSVGQTADMKIPETIGAFATLASAIPKVARESKLSCQPRGTLYPVEAGTPNLERPIEFPITTQNPADDLLDINKATKEELMSLPGIGNAEAITIINTRPYSTKEDVIPKAGIPQATFDKIKDQIVVKNK